MYAIRSLSKFLSTTLVVAAALAPGAAGDQLVEAARVTADEDGVGTLPCMAQAPDGTAVAAWVDPGDGTVELALWSADEDRAPVLAPLADAPARLEVGISADARIVLALDHDDRSEDVLLGAGADGAPVELARVVRWRPGLACEGSAVLADRSGGVLVVRALRGLVDGEVHLELALLAAGGSARATITEVPLGTEVPTALAGALSDGRGRLAWRSGSAVRSVWLEIGPARVEPVGMVETLEASATSAPFVAVDGVGVHHVAWSDQTGRPLHRRDVGPDDALDPHPVAVPWVFGPDGVGTLPAMVGGALRSFGVDFHGAITLVMETTGGAHALARVTADRAPVAGGPLAPGAWDALVDGFGNVRFAYAHGALDLGTLRRETLRAEAPFAPGATVPLTLSSRGDAGLVHHVFASGGVGAIPLDGRVLGLAPDALFQASASGSSPVFQGFAGVLDADGVGTLPRVVLPPDPSLSGRTLALAFVTASLDGGVRTVSDVRSFTVE